MEFYFEFSIVLCTYVGKMAITLKLLKIKQKEVNIRNL